MDLKITTLAGKDAGKLKLNEEIFGLDPREDSKNGTEDI